MNASIDGTENGRLLDGRFAAGNKISKGNLGNMRMKKLRRSLLDATSAEDVKAVGSKLLELAKGGDVAAAKVWLDHVIGRPKEAVEISGPDGSTLDLSVIVSVIMLALGDDQAARGRGAAAFRQLGRADGGLDADGMGA